MPISKQEQAFYDVLRANYIHKIMQSYRPDFLKNTKTGNNLEIDIWFPMQRIGFEYQGAVHFKNIARYKNDSDKSRLSDLNKNCLLDYKKRRDICIVELFEQDISGNILNNILQRIINTQLYYFNKGQFGKCRQLEIIYGILTKQSTTKPFKHSKRWFDRCDEVQKAHLLKRLNPAIHTLIEFYKAVNGDFALPERGYFDIKKVSQILGITKTNVIISYFLKQPIN